jgi:hypothetical protein
VVPLLHGLEYERGGRGSPFYRRGHLGLSTIFVAWYVHKYEHGTLCDLGIHTKKLKTALGVSAFLGLGSLPYYFQVAGAQDISMPDALIHLSWSLLMRPGIWGNSRYISRCSRFYALSCWLMTTGELTVGPDFELRWTLGTEKVI